MLEASFRPESGIASKANHPVVQIVYQDALAYANWAAKDYWFWLNGSGLQRRPSNYYPWGNEKLIVEKLNLTTGQEHFLQKI